MCPGLLQSHGALPVSQLLTWRALLSGHRKTPSADEATAQEKEKQVLLWHISLWHSLHLLQSLPTTCLSCLLWYPYRRWAGQWWCQLPRLQLMISWPITWGRRLRRFSTGNDSASSGGLVLLHFDTNTHADIPAGEEVQRWRAGLNHSVERQTQPLNPNVIWVWWGLGTCQLLFSSWYHYSKDQDTNKFRYEFFMRLLLSDCSSHWHNDNAGSVCMCSSLRFKSGWNEAPCNMNKLKQLLEKSWLTPPAK